MSERSEIATAPHRAVTRHHWGDLRVERGDERFSHRRAHAGKAHRKSTSPEQHRRPHHLTVDWRADAGRVRTYQGELQLRLAEGRDSGSGQRAEPGRNAIDGFARLRRPLHASPAL